MSIDSQIKFLYRQVLGGMLGSAILKDGNPLTLHYVMFIPAIMGQGTVEQQGYWISKAWTCSIIGTYAQVYAYFIIIISSLCTHFLLFSHEIEMFFD